MTATPEIIDALNESYGSASSKAAIAAITEGEGGTTWNILFGGSMWTGSLDMFPSWPGVRLSNGMMTHAFGALQFQPGTYADAAKLTGRASVFPQDQIQNGWAWADHIFASRMPSITLHAALETGGAYLMLITTYLHSTWIGGCDSGFPKRFISNLPLVRASSPPPGFARISEAILA
jgi:hypothetical protein